MVQLLKTRLLMRMSTEPPRFWSARKSRLHHIDCLSTETVSIGGMVNGIFPIILPIIL